MKIRIVLPEVCVGHALEYLDSVLDLVRAGCSCVAWCRRKERLVYVVAERKGLAVDLLEGCRGSKVRKLLQLERAFLEFKVDWSKSAESELARCRFSKYPQNVVALYAAACVEGLVKMDDPSFFGVVRNGFDTLLRTIPSVDLARRAEALAPAFLALLARVLRYYFQAPQKHPYALDVASLIPRFPPETLLSNLDRILALLRPLYDLDSQEFVRCAKIHATYANPLALFYIYKAIAKIPIRSTTLAQRHALIDHYTIHHRFHNRPRQSAQERQNRKLFNAAIGADLFRKNTIDKLAVGAGDDTRPL